MNLQRILFHFQYEFQNLAQRHLFDDVLVQVSWVFAMLILSAYTSKVYYQYAERQLAELAEDSIWARRLWEIKESIAYPLALVCSLFLFIPIGDAFGFQTEIVFIANQLAVAFLIIRVLTHLIYNKLYTRLVSWLIWILAALKIIGLWEPLRTSMNAVQFQVSGSDTSLWLVLKGASFLLITAWIAIQIAHVFDVWTSRIEGFSQSHQVLAQKFFRIVIVLTLLLFGLNEMGMKLQTLTIFSGALGVGLGFGMQKVLSNFISGILLLMDKSIKPGDVIGLDNMIGKAETYQFGWVRSLGARYVSVITRDGMEHLIPNETLITTHVENWSHSANEVRLKMRLQITYDSDVDLALKIIEEEAQAHDRVIKKDKVGPRIIGLATDGVTIELRIWISDPINGVTNVRSHIYQSVLKRFKEEGIRIPYRRNEHYIHEIDQAVVDKLADAFFDRYKTYLPKPKKS